MPKRKTGYYNNLRISIFAALIMILFVPHRVMAGSDGDENYAEISRNTINTFLDKRGKATFGSAELESLLGYYTKDFLAENKIANGRDYQIILLNEIHHSNQIVVNISKFDATHYIALVDSIVYGDGFKAKIREKFVLNCQSKICLIDNSVIYQELPLALE